MRGLAMINKHLVLAIGAFLLAGVTPAFGQLIRVGGFVLVESEDHTRKPVPNALIDIYFLQQGGHWEARTDQNGHYNLNLMKQQGSWLVVVSGPGLMPIWDYDAHLDDTPVMDFVTYPGAGNWLSLADVLDLRAKGGSSGVYEPPIRGVRNTVTPNWSEDRRAQYFGSLDGRTAAQSAIQTPIKTNAQQSTTDVASAATRDRPKEAPVLHKADTAGELGYREDPSSASATETRSAGKESAEKERPIKLEARLVNLNISAVNHAGVAVPNLKKEDFSVYENGVKQSIAFFEKNDSPVNLMLLLDLSSSARDKIKLIKTAASRFISLLPPGDRIGVAAFTRRYYLISDFTSNHALLKDRIEHTENLEGGTAFYDAMWTAMAEMDRSGVSRKALVVLTDGVDENLLDFKLHPSQHTFKEMLERVSEDDVTVYPIYLDTESEETKRAVQQLGQRAARWWQGAYATARTQLYELADSTGGALIRAAYVGELARAYQKVVDELHSLYSLAYTPKDLKSNGRWRKIHVKTDQKGVVLRTRRGFYDK